MAKDYAPRRQAPVKQSRIPRWVWIFSTTVIIAFISALYYLSQVEVKEVDNDSVKLKNTGEAILTDVKNSIKESINEKDVQNLSEKASEKIEQVKEVTQDAKEAKEAFEFYEKLKTQEVVVPKAEPLDIEAINAAKKQYILQAASFKTIEDAQALRRDLILSGVPDVGVESANGWHRVFAGPYASEIKLSRTKAILVDQFKLNPLKKCKINCK